MAPYLSLNLIHNRSIYPTPNPNPSPSQKQYAQMFAIIDAYLSHSSPSAKATASILIEPINETYTQGAYETSRFPDHTATQESCLMLFGIILDLAVQIPHAHHYQDLLVDLIEAIKAYPGEWM